MKKILFLLYFLSFNVSASFVSQPVAIPMQDSHVSDLITVGPEGTVMGEINGNPAFQNGIRISTDTTQNLIGYQADGTPVIYFNLLSPDDATAGYRYMVNILQNNQVGWTGDGNESVGLRYRTKISHGNQTATVRGFDSILSTRGDATVSGIGVNALRASNISISHGSVNEAAELVAQNSTVLSGDASVTVGNIAQATGYQIQIGFGTAAQEPDNGTITNGNGVLIRTPQNTSATRTITTNAAIEIEDQEATGITDAYAIKTGLGEVHFGGGMTFKHVSVGADYTLDDNDYIVGVSDLSAARTLVILSANTVEGKTYVIKDEYNGASINNITILTEGTEKIDEAHSAVISTDLGKIELYSDGNNWYSK